MTTILESRKVLVLSTGHLKAATCQMLATTKTANWPVVGGPWTHGYFVYAHDEDGGEEGIPEELAVCCVFARRHGYDYIMFDCDGNIVDELPDYTATYP